MFLTPFIIFLIEILSQEDNITNNNSIINKERQKDTISFSKNKLYNESNNELFFQICNKMTEYNKSIILEMELNYDLIKAINMKNSILYKKFMISYEKITEYNYKISNNLNSFININILLNNIYEQLDDLNYTYYIINISRKIKHILKLAKKLIKIIITNEEEFNDMNKSENAEIIISLLEKWYFQESSNLLNIIFDGKKRY